MLVIGLGWDKDHRPFERRAVPDQYSGSFGSVLITPRDGNMYDAVIVETDAHGIRLRLRRSTHDGNHYVSLRFVPWANVSSVEWAETDPVANRRAREEEKNADHP